MKHFVLAKRTNIACIALSFFHNLPIAFLKQVIWVYHIRMTLQRTFDKKKLYACRFSLELIIEMFVHSIWDHLVEITKGGRTTVIITTHYIDETKQADIVSIFSILLYYKILVEKN